MDDRELVREILQSGKFSELCGLPENDWLECKSGTYNLDDEFHCHELAKDVTALANAGGGLIIIGARTRLDDEHSSEVIEEIRSFSRDLVSTVRYHDTIAARTYPPITGLTVEWMAGADTPEKGLVVITIPDSKDDRPVLAQKITAEDGKTAATVFGYYERRRSTASHYSVQQLHAMIKDGAKSAALHARLDTLTDAMHRLADQANSSASPSYDTIERPLSAPESASTEVTRPTARNLRRPPSEFIRPRIEALLRDVQLDGKPSIAF